ncbi:hypothetical protein OUZ56_008971 [Daphnia magna]|uniref:Uncharacterized protein n=1 Tax=Daphnia magna TaxID=35525 RepID=A0ABR0AEL8_9CRUS|nr:hypothetical protein OUZ56_008971 [Daphnia magna]
MPFKSLKKPPGSAPNVLGLSPNFGPVRRDKMRTVSYMERLNVRTGQDKLRTGICGLHAHTKY